MKIDYEKAITDICNFPFYSEYIEHEDEFYMVGVKLDNSCSVESCLVVSLKDEDEGEIISGELENKVVETFLDFECCVAIHKEELDMEARAFYDEMRFEESRES